MASLRGEEGCAWDKKQTIHGFKTFLLEEVYELIDAIEREDYAALKEEMGDLLFHIVFIAQICSESQRFTIKDVLDEIYEKMYRRHPHVFQRINETPVNAADIPEQWEEIKKQEKEDYSPVANVPKILPALLRAYIISKRAARTGFDWDTLEDIYEKMHEEISELKEAEQTQSTERIEEELGDLLFTVVNISRRHGIDPENALRRTNTKFIRRFTYVHDNSSPSAKSNLQAMDALWNKAKEKEKIGE